MTAKNSSQSYIDVTGMVINVMPVGEYDRRVVLLTRERGRVSAFAKGARRPNSPLIGSTNLFCFGTFRLFIGRESYSLGEVKITNYFDFFRTHMEESLMGQYFLEIMEYCTRENNDESELLLLTYQSLRALESPNIPDMLVKSIFEIKTVVIEGEFEPPEPGSCSPAVYRALDYIARSGIAKLYTFVMDERPMNELRIISEAYMKSCFNHSFKSLDIIRGMDTIALIVKSE